MQTNYSLLYKTYRMLSGLWIMMLIIAVGMVLMISAALIFPDFTGKMLTSGFLTIQNKIIRTAINRDNPIVLPIILTFATLNIVLTMIIVRILKIIFSRLITKNIFSMDNVKSIRVIGFISIGGNIFIYALFTVVTMLHAGLSDLVAYYLPDFYPTFFGLVILAMAEVFKRGAELQTDHDLTV